MASEVKKIDHTQLQKFIKAYVVCDGRDFRLKDHDPADTHHLNSEYKPEAKRFLDEGVKALSKMQDTLYAQAEWGLLLIFQAMDAAGKDGTIKHVMSGVNPQGVEVASFKAPTSEEFAHGYLWRCVRCLPPRGKIGIFNRSYYEEVLIVRVHPELLDSQRIPRRFRGHHFWKHRFEDINSFEQYLTRNGIAIRKFFLNVSREEQKKRFMERLTHPDKNWKFSASDVKEREFWDDYQDVYEKMIRNTATEHAPWIVVPADNKWFSRILVVASIVDALNEMDLKYPKVTDEKLAELKEARRQLENEK